MQSPQLIVETRMMQREEKKNTQNKPRNRIRNGIFEQMEISINSRLCMVHEFVWFVLLLVKLDHMESAHQIPTNKKKKSCDNIIEKNSKQISNFVFFFFSSNPHLILSTRRMLKKNSARNKNRVFTVHKNIITHRNRNKYGCSVSIASTACTQQHKKQI